MNSPVEIPAASGTKDQKAHAQAGDQQTQEVEPSKGRSRAWGIALVVSIIALGAGGFAYFTTGQEAETKKQGPEVKVVRTALSLTETLPLEAEYRGELIAETADIAAQASGRLLDVKKDLGDEVKEGELLALVDVSETQRLLAEAIAQHKSAQAAQKSAETQSKAAIVEYERGQKLEKENLLSGQEVANLQAQVGITEAQLESSRANISAAAARISLYQNQIKEARLVAPFDGSVAERYLDAGSSVTPGSPVLRIVKSQAIRLRFRASERHLRHLGIGSPLSLTTLATGDNELIGKVTRIGAEVSRTDRSVGIEASIEGDASKLKPGMYAIIHVQLGTLKDVTTVPSSALITRLDDYGAPVYGVMLFVDGHAQHQAVEFLGAYKQRSAVKPLDAGVKVISFGQDFVNNGAPVREVNNEAQ